MAYLEKHLEVKESTLPGAGKGLFTKVDIPKGTWIVEYQGEILTWKEVEKMADHRNGYVFFVFHTHVIDAWRFKKKVARYANDARGLVRIKGVNNNCEYHVYKRRCYIRAIRNIKAGSELFVDYGREYWQAIRDNIRQEARDKAEAAKKKGKKLTKSAPELPHHQDQRSGKKRSKKQ